MQAIIFFPAFPSGIIFGEKLGHHPDYFGYITRYAHILGGRAPACPPPPGIDTPALYWDVRLSVITDAYHEMSQRCDERGCGLVRLRRLDKPRTDWDAVGPSQWPRRGRATEVQTLRVDGKPVVRRTVNCARHTGWAKRVHDTILVLEFPPLLDALYSHRSFIRSSFSLHEVIRNSIRRVDEFCLYANKF